MFVNEFDGLELEFNPDGFPVTMCAHVRLHGDSRADHAHFGQGHHFTVLDGHYRAGEPTPCMVCLRQLNPSQYTDLWTLLGWVFGYLLITFIGVKLRTVGRCWFPLCQE